MGGRLLVFTPITVGKLAKCDTSEILNAGSYLIELDASSVFFQRLSTKRLRLSSFKLVYQRRTIGDNERRSRKDD